MSDFWEDGKVEDASESIVIYGCRRCRKYGVLVEDGTCSQCEMDIIHAWPTTAAFRKMMQERTEKLMQEKKENDAKAEAALAAQHSASATSPVRQDGMYKYLQSKK